VPFSEVAPILEQRCLSCHATLGGWQNTETWYKNSGKIIAGNLAASSLYTYLASNPEGYSPAYMPRGLPALPSEEILLIRQWILGVDGGDSRPPSSQFEFSCANESLASTAPLKRLSRTQLKNTFIDLLSPFTSVEQAEIYGSISAALDTFPADSPRKNFLEERAFSGTDLSVSGQHISALYESARSFASQVTSTLERRLLFSRGDCAFGSSGVGHTCLDNFISRFGLKALRRPLTSGESSDYAAYYLAQPSATAYRDLIVTMLMAPDFFYQREDAGVPEVSDPATLRLTAYELASRLSLLFWQTTPDDVLLAAAANGSLLTDAGYKEQTERLFSNPRTKETVDLFFDELLGTDRLPALNGINSPAFNSFAAGLEIAPGSTELVEQMRQELTDLIDHYVWQTNQNFSDLFLSPYSFARSPALAAIYGVQPWSGSHQELVPFPAEQQARGLLGRAVVQVSGSHLKETAKLGARILREWNCTPLGDPPADLMNQVRPPAYDPTKSTRQRYEDLTAPVSCAGCHAQINPIGFAMERIDALGRYREIEDIFDSSGIRVSRIPINSSVEFSPVPGSTTTVSSPIQVFRAMIDSGKAQACFAQQYFRFAHRAHEVLSEDGCALRRLHGELKREGGSLQGMLKQLVSSDDFKLRRLVE